MESIFEILAWAAMAALLATSVPQIVLNHKRKATSGVSWTMFGLLLFGMATMFVHSLITEADIVIKLNFGIGSFIVLLANLQILYYRVVRKSR